MFNIDIVKSVFYAKYDYYYVISIYFDIKTLMHNAPNGQTHFKNLAAFAARYVKCLTILGHYALKS